MLRDEGRTFPPLPSSPDQGIQSFPGNPVIAAGRPVAADCHGPAVFRHTKAKDGTPLVRGKSVTGFANSEEEAIGLTKVVPFLLEHVFKQQGGNSSKAAAFQPHVVTDGHLITGRNPPSSEATANAVLQRLQQGAKWGSRSWDATLASRRREPPMGKNLL